MVIPSSSSEILLRGRGHSLPEHRALDHIPIPRMEEGVHNRLNPRLVHIDKEILHCLLRSRVRGIIQPSTLQRTPAAREAPPTASTSAYSAQTQCLVARARQQEEANVGTSDPARDEVIGVLVDVLEVHWGGTGGRRGPPLDFFDDVEGGVQNEGRELALRGGEAGDAVAAAARGAEFVGEERGVGRRENGEEVGHFRREGRERRCWCGRRELVRMRGGLEHGGAAEGLRRARVRARQDRPRIFEDRIVRIAS